MKSTWTLLPVVLATVAVGASCGQVAESEVPTAPMAIAPAGGESHDEGGASASNVQRVTVCHLDEETGAHQELTLPEVAVSPHLQHDDTLGSCLPDCPCFSLADIQAAAAQCASPTWACGTGAVHGLSLGCYPGGSVPPVFLGSYDAQEGSSGFACRWYDRFDFLEQTGLTDAEYQACVDAIDLSGFCD